MAISAFGLRNFYFSDHFDFVDRKDVFKFWDLLGINLFSYLVESFDYLLN